MQSKLEILEKRISKLEKQFMKENVYDREEPVQKYIVSVYENTPCRERRPTTDEDVINDLTKMVITSSVDDVYSTVLRDVLFVPEEDIYSNEESKITIENTDTGMGDPFIVSIYDVNTRRFLYGDRDSMYECAIEYNDEDNLRALADKYNFDFDDFVNPTIE